MKKFKLRRGQRLSLSHSLHGPAGEVEVLRRIGEGGQAQVYLARRPLPEGEWEFVVLKAPRVQEEVATDFIREEYFAAQQDSRHLIRFLGSCEQVKGQPGPVLALERGFAHPLLIMNRPSLRASLSNDPGKRYYPLPPDCALELGLDLLCAIEHLHAQEVVHCDIKLANLLIVLAGVQQEELLTDEEVLRKVADKAGRCVLTDLGSCRTLAELDALNAGEPDAPTPVLTPIYAPPEAVLERDGSRRIHPSIDLYAAAMVIYASLTGQAPYDHLEADATKLEGLVELKLDELNGSSSPFSRTAIEELPLHDVEFRSGSRMFVDDVLGFLESCTHRIEAKRPTAAAARTRFQELFAFRKEGERIQQGTFRASGEQSRLLEPFRSNLGELLKAPAGQRPRVATDEQLSSVKRLLQRELRSLPAETLGATLGRVRAAARLNVCLDPLRLLLNEGSISVAAARRMRPQISDAGYPLPPSTPRLGAAAVDRVLDFLCQEEELDPATSREAESTAQALEAACGISVCRLQVLLSQAALSPRTLRWALDLVEQRQALHEESCVAPRTQGFMVRGDLALRERKGTRRRLRSQTKAVPKTRSGTARVKAKATGRLAPARQVRPLSAVLQRVSLSVSDLLSSRAFYIRCGLAVQGSSEEGVLLSCEAGRELELLLTSQAVSPQRLVLTYDSEAAHRLGVDFARDGVPATPPFTLLDPDGHRVAVRVL